MQARVKAGWITEADLAKPAEEAEAEPKNSRLRRVRSDVTRMLADR